MTLNRSVILSGARSISNIRPGRNRTDILRAFSLWGLVAVLAKNQIADSGIEAGWAIDYSVDPIPRDARLTLALLLGGVAVWSRKATKIGLIIYGCVYPLLEFYTWVVASRHGAFDSTEPAVHIAGAVVLFSGIVLWLRGKSTIIISALAPAYVSFEYLIWYIETNQLKDAAGVAMLAPPTPLNNLLHGAHWWHVVLFVFICTNDRLADETAAQRGVIIRSRHHRDVRLNGKDVETNDPFSAMRTRALSITSLLTPFQTGG